MIQGRFRNIALVSLLFLPMTLSVLNVTLIPNSILNSKELGGYLITAILFLMASARSFKGNKIILNKLDIAIFFFLVAIPLVHSLFIHIPLTSLLRSYMCASLYCCTRIITVDFTWETRLFSFYTAAFIISILQIIISAAQYWEFVESYHRLRVISGMFFNPGPFAIYLSSFTVLIFTLVYYFHIRLNHKMMWISIIVTFCLICILLQLYSRTAWISVIIGLILLYSLNKGVSNKMYTGYRVIRYALCIGMFLIPLAILFYYMRPGSVTGRRLIWNSTLEMIKSNPIFGVGLGRFKSEYAHFQGFFLSKNDVNMKLFGGFADETNYAFNDFLQLIAEQGIIAGGLCIYIMAQGYILFSSKAKYMSHTVKILYYGIIVSTIVILLSGLASYPFQMLPITVSFWITIAICNCNPENKNDGIANKNYQRIAGYTLIIFALAFSYIFFAKTRSYFIWQQSREGKMVRIENLLQIYPYLKDDADFNNHLGHWFYRQKQYQQALRFFRNATLNKFEKDHIYDLGMCLSRLCDFKAAENQYEIIQSCIPHLMKPKFLIAKLYLSMGDLHKFRSKASEFLIASENSKNFEIQLLRREMARLINANQINKLYKQIVPTVNPSKTTKKINIKMYLFN
jgi:O-antigen ligase